jgi:hypothetical protein
MRDSSLAEQTRYAADLSERSRMVAEVERAEFCVSVLHFLVGTPTVGSDARPKLLERARRVLLSLDRRGPDSVVPADVPLFGAEPTAGIGAWVAALEAAVETWDLEGRAGARRRREPIERPNIPTDRALRTGKEVRLVHRGKNHRKM